MSAKLGLFLVLLAIAAVAVVAACSPQPRPEEPTPIPSLVPATMPPEPTSAPLPTSAGPSGNALFNDNCGNCHNLSDQPKVGPGLAGLFGKAALPTGKAVTDDNLAEWIRQGGGAMPGFALSDAEMAALIAFLREATGAAPPAAPTEQPTTAPAASGADVFANKCSACHNLTAETKVGPGLAGLFGKAALPNGNPVNDGNLREWIRQGGGSMPGIALADADLEVLIAYLRETLGSVSSIATPAPDTSAGAAVFEANCAVCHNLTAETKVGPGLAGLFGRSALPNGEPVDEDNLRDWIRKGGGAMPGIKLEDEALDDLIAYLKEATR